MERAEPWRNETRLLGGIHLFSACCFFVFGLIYWGYVESRYMLLSNLVFAALCGLNWLLYRRLGRYGLFAATFLSLVYLGLVNVAVHLGNHTSPLLFWGLSVLIAAAFIYDEWGTALWTALSLLYLPLSLYLKRSVVPARSIPLDPFQADLLHDATYLGLGLFLGYTCILFRRKLNRTLGKLARTNRELEQARTGLETRVALRTAELARANERLKANMVAHLQMEKESRLLEAQLRHSQKLESLGIMAGGIAHDFNNLLLAILLNAELARRKLAPGSPILVYLDGILTSAKQSAGLTRQMLAYAGKGAVSIELVALNPLVAEMSKLLEGSISKKIAVVHRFADELPTVKADPSQLRQIIMNLLLNASEAVGDVTGSITLTTSVAEYDRAFLQDARLEEELPAGEYVTLVVSDTGCGMDERTRSTIFDPFFSTKFTGRGLGLAVVLGIVRGHQGGIRVESAPGQGATFTVLLPSVRRFGAAEVPGGAQPEEGARGGERGGGTVLLVDDEALVRQVAEMALRELGFSVLTAADGVEAIEVFRARHEEIVCVLLDQNMPRLCGTEALPRLREIRDDIPVVLCSGLPAPEARSRYTDGQFAAFLKKPYQLAGLRTLLCEVLARDRDGDRDRDGKMGTPTSLVGRVE